MKIAIFSDAFYPVNSGVVSYLATVVQELSAKGHKIYLFVPKFEDNTYKRIFNSNVKVFRYSGLNAPTHPDFKFTSILRLDDLKRFKDINPDIVFYQTPFTMGLKGITLAKIFNKPLVGVFHTRIAEKDTLNNLIKIGKKINLEKAAWGYIKSFYKDCDAIISPSEDIKKDLDKHKINEHVIVINNFVDTKKLDNKESKIKIKPNSFVYFGRLSVEKNLFCLLSSFKLVLNENKNTYLYLIGDGPLRSSLEEFVIENKMKDNVFFLGQLEREVILKTNLLSKFLAITTMSNSEVQPLSLIESMFKGLPILGPDSDGIKELIKGNGIIVGKNSTKEMAKAILTLLKNPSLQKKLSLASLERAKNYDSKLLISKLEKESERIIAHHQKKRSWLFRNL
jgi:1,2-diacylglycerol 3-alpha-glucosyltransferase